MYKNTLLAAKGGAFAPPYPLKSATVHSPFIRLQCSFIGFFLWRFQDFSRVAFAENASFKSCGVIF